MSHETVTLTCHFNATGNLHIYRDGATWLNPEKQAHLVEVDDPYTVNFVVSDPATTNQTAHAWQRTSFTKWAHDGSATKSGTFKADVDAEFRIAVADIGQPISLDDFDGTLPGAQSVKIKIKIRKKGVKPIS